MIARMSKTIALAKELGLVEYISLDHSGNQHQQQMAPPKVSKESVNPVVKKEKKRKPKRKES